MKTFFKLYLSVMALFCLGWFVHPYLNNLAIEALGSSYKSHVQVYSFVFFISFVMLSIYLIEGHIINWDDRIWLNTNEGFVGVLTLLCLFSSLLIVVWKFIPFQHLFNIIIL